MAHDRIVLNDVSLRFRMSYDKLWSARDGVAALARRFGRRRQPRKYFQALEAINLTVSESDIVGLIGPNGCGKSTLLRTISGIYQPDTGSVQTNGRISAVLTLGTGFDQRLTGVDNIRLNGLTLGLSRREIDAKIDEIIEFAEIGEHIYQPMKYYSNGMISRLSFAIFLAIRPEIMLIDEIFSVGDLNFQRKCKEAMSRILSQAACQLIVTHDLQLVQHHCNRAIYMDGGQIIADGQPSEVVALYQRDCELGRTRAARRSSGQAEPEVVQSGPPPELPTENEPQRKPSRRAAAYSSEAA